ncbi:hypothetical protein FQN54_009909 [Arachnomyces sp. PD_36]|nr:hypothetical protein FQN54_009909 [Arachnomyces sp. PD_36]
MAPSLPSGQVDIVEIHQNDFDTSLVKDIYNGLNVEKGEGRTLPTLLLYDSEGLRLFEEITYLDEYYLTNAEIEVLTTHAKTIVEKIPENSQLVELGSGNLRKIEILLNEFERVGKNVEYFALDLSLEELERTLCQIPTKSYAHVKCRGLHGTYDDALTWLRAPENRQKPTSILSLGSSIGNFNRADAAQFLAGFAESLRPSDSILIGLDACKDPEKVFRAYNDSEGVTQQFNVNGLVRANSILGFEAFRVEDWDAIGAYSEIDGCHQAFFCPRRDVEINGIILKKGERILFEQSFKYDSHESSGLWHKAGLNPVSVFGNSTDDYHIHMLTPSALNLPTNPEKYVTNPVPSLEDYESLWTAWDIATKSMIPQEELLSKPIALRNCLVFYLGHIPTFLDIHITRATGGQPTEPKSYPSIFERGIDPDVDNPEQCHAHSELPSEWPPVEEISDFQENVRNRVRDILNRGAHVNNRLLSEALWIGFEHEAMHLETFLYMLLQSERILPPPGVTTPDFKLLASRAKKNAVPNEWFTVPATRISIGLDDDPSGNRVPEHSFGWDNEKPRRETDVPSFSASARPITNGEYAAYLEQNNISAVPAYWVENSASMNGNGGVASNGFGHTTGSNKLISASEKFLNTYSVRTVFGLVPLRFCLDWPAMASYNELHGYAEWKNCRIPSFEEVRSLYKHSEELKSKDRPSMANGDSRDINGARRKRDSKIEDIVNGSSSNDHQPVKPVPSGHQQPVYIDLDGCNVGFKHWHPTPVTHLGNKLCGQGELGGVWEWTSSPLKEHDGFRAMEIYPGYTADFFDDKHNIVLGGSWATHPRIAGRTTFVNWYQRNYLYPWAGARLVRDL